MKTSRKRGPSAPAADPSEAAGPGASHLHVTRQAHELFAFPPPIVERILFSRVGHTFGPAFSLFGPPSYVVQDFLLDQTGASGADGKMRNTKLFDLTTATDYGFEIFPKDRSKRITVKVPGPGQVFMGLDLGRRFVNAMSDVASGYTAFSHFVDLAGNVPHFTYNQFFIGRNTNHWIQFVVNADVTSAISFAGLTVYGVYPQRSFDPGIKSYLPFSNSLPFNLPGPNAVPFVMFGYHTQSSVDPGPFVTLS